MWTFGTPHGAWGLDLISSKYQRVTFMRASLTVVGFRVRVQSSAAVSFFESCLKMSYWRPSTQPPGRNELLSGT